MSIFNKLKGLQRPKSMTSARTFGQQHLDDAGVPLGGGDHERRTSVLVHLLERRAAVHDHVQQLPVTCSAEGKGVRSRQEATLEVHLCPTSTASLFSLSGAGTFHKLPL